MIKYILLVSVLLLGNSGCKHNIEYPDASPSSSTPQENNTDKGKEEGQPPQRAKPPSNPTDEIEDPGQEQAGSLSPTMPPKNLDAGRGNTRRAAETGQLGKERVASPTSTISPKNLDAVTKPPSNPANVEQPAQEKEVNDGPLTMDEAGDTELTMSQKEGFVADEAGGIELPMPQKEGFVADEAGGIELTMPQKEGFVADEAGGIELTMPQEGGFVTDKEGGIELTMPQEGGFVTDKEGDIELPMPQKEGFVTDEEGGIELTMPQEEGPLAGGDEKNEDDGVKSKLSKDQIERSKRKRSVDLAEKMTDFAALLDKLPEEFKGIVEQDFFVKPIKFEQANPSDTDTQVWEPKEFQEIVNFLRSPDEKFGLYSTVHMLLGSIDRCEQRYRKKLEQESDGASTLFKQLTSIRVGINMLNAAIKSEQQSKSSETSS